jgi:small ligand-binding sensory domain FIST
MPDNAPSQTRCGAACSTQADTAAAVAEVCRQAMDQLNAPVDLAVAFVSHHHGPHFGALAASLCKYLGTENLIGCTGESIAGDSRELEDQPALSLWLAHLPGAQVERFHLQFERTPDGGTFVGWPEIDAAPSDDSSAISHDTLLLLGEPYSCPADALLERLNEDSPGVQVLGGMASGGHEPGMNRVMCGPHEFGTGAAVVRLRGARVRPIVSQGCRPIGNRFVITKADRNVLLGLGGKPPLEQFRGIYAELPNHEQMLVRNGLHVGVVTDEYRDDYSRGDFLVRNVVGVDPESGAIAIGDYARVGTTVQFHLRDAASADEDLRELLAAYRKRRLAELGGDDSLQPCAGALLFTCNGRGTRLFEQPHHDAAAVQNILGPLPLAGFFAQGELGPIGPRNYLHGFTASIAVFE